MKKIFAPLRINTGGEGILCEIWYVKIMNSLFAPQNVFETLMNSGL